MLNRFAKTIVVIIALFLGTEAARADYILVDKNGKYVGHVPNPAPSGPWGGAHYFLREMATGLWVRFMLSDSPATINVHEGNFYYELDNCSGASWLAYDPAQEWFPPGYILATNLSGTRGTIVYPVGQYTEIKQFKSARDISENSNCYTYEADVRPVMSATKYFKTVNINSWRLEAPFKIVIK